MKVHHAYCGKQHWSAIHPICEELRRRGHEIAEVSLMHDDVRVRKPGFENVDTSNSDVFLCSYPHIMLHAGKDGSDIRYPLNNEIKICIEHGVNPVAWAWPLERHNMFDHLFLAGRWQLDAVRRVGGQLLLKKCIVTGWPKVDALVGLTAVDRMAARDALEKKMKKPFGVSPVVAWVPTHGGAWKRTNEIVKYMPKNVNLVIAPHEGKYVAFRDGTLGMNYQEEYPFYIETPNIYEVLKAADVVISDYSSAMIEAAVMGVPIIQILDHVTLYNRETFDPYMAGYYALSMLDKREFRMGKNIANLRELPNEIDIALKMKGDFWRNEREFWVNEIFSNLGNATMHCCNIIEKIYADSKL